MNDADLAVETAEGDEALALLPTALDTLPRAAPSPFLSFQWLRAWSESFNSGEPVSFVVRRDGEVVAGAFCHRSRAGLSSPSNDHTGDWDVFGTDPAGRQAAWCHLAKVGGLRVRLGRLPEWTGADREAARTLRAAGYRVVVERGPLSPYLRLPAQWDALIGGRSRNLRAQARRQRRGLEREGEVVLRTSRDEPSIARDLDVLLQLEASGWKGRSGSAITADQRTARLYRSFSLAAARAGMARLHLLEVDGVAVAGDLSVVLGDTEFLIKTAYDEAWSQLSPGLVLRVAVLRRAIEEESLTAYDFLGAPDAYKVRWTADVRPRVTVLAYRDPPGYWYRAAMRPALKRVALQLKAARS